MTRAILIARKQGNSMLPESNCFINRLWVSGFEWHGLLTRVDMGSKPEAAEYVKPQNHLANPGDVVLFVGHKGEEWVSGGRWWSTCRSSRDALSRILIDIVTFPLPETLILACCFSFSICASAAGDEIHLYVVPATNLLILFPRWWDLFKNRIFGCIQRVSNQSLQRIYHSICMEAYWPNSFWSEDSTG